MLFPFATELTDLALLLLRLAIAAIFWSSGWQHFTEPVERGESIGFPPAAARALGFVELAGAASIALGLWAQAGALALMAVMLGAIYKKAVVWKTGFWGEESNGWYYDLLYLIANLVIFATGGGALSIT